MADVVKLDSQEKKLVQLAALLHDVGHGPFSHVSEASLARFADRGKLAAGQRADKIHELVTAQIIQSDPEICQLVEKQDDREAVSNCSMMIWSSRSQIISVRWMRTRDYCYVLSFAASVWHF
jgi:HD superfamily phosphohydrolase